ncbi:MAG: DUF357 domain-containing protein [Candidatus Altiarchaeota archaeon]
MDATDELKTKLEKYMKKAEPRFAEITVLDERGAKVKDTALRYYSDAKHFLSKGEYVNAFAALEYAEGWLDAGVAVGAVKTNLKI